MLYILNMNEIHWSTEFMSIAHCVHLSMLLILILSHMPCNIMAINKTYQLNGTEISKSSLAPKLDPDSYHKFLNKSQQIYAKNPPPIIKNHVSDLNNATTLSSINDTKITVSETDFKDVVNKTLTLVDSHDLDIALNLFKPKKRDVTTGDNDTEASNSLEDNDGTALNKGRSYKHEEILVNKILSPTLKRQPPIPGTGINPPLKLKKILQKYQTQATSRVFKEFFAWNEKCMAVSFTQTITVEEHELRETLALDQNINMGLKDDWVCDPIYVINQFCFGVCRSFRYPIQDKSGYDPKSLTLVPAEGDNVDHQSVKGMLKHVKKSYEATVSSKKGDKNEVKYNAHQSLNLDDGPSSYRPRSRRSLGFFCSACVPQKVKYHEVKLNCYPKGTAHNSVTDYQKTSFEMRRQAENTENPNNIMLFFLNRFGITPNVNGQNESASGQNKKTNQIPKHSAPFYAGKNFKAGINVTVTKSVPVVESCNCQPCSSHDMFL